MGGRKTLFRSRKVFSDAFQTKYRPDIPPCQGLKVYFGVVLGCKGGGGERKNISGPESLFLIWAPETRQHRQDKPRQVKGSLRGQMTSSESGLCLAEAVDISLGGWGRTMFVLGMEFRRT